MNYNYHYISRNYIPSNMNRNQILGAIALVLGITIAAIAGVMIYLNREGDSSAPSAFSGGCGGGYTSSCGGGYTKVHSNPRTDNYNSAHYRTTYIPTSNEPFFNSSNNHRDSVYSSSIHVPNDNLSSNNHRDSVYSSSIHVPNDNLSSNNHGASVYSSSIHVPNDNLSSNNQGASVYSSSIHVPNTWN